MTHKKADTRRTKWKFETETENLKEEFPSTFQCQKEVTEGGNSGQEITTIEITQSEETEK